MQLLHAITEVQGNVEPIEDAHPQIQHFDTHGCALSLCVLRFIAFAKEDIVLSVHL